MQSTLQHLKLEIARSLKVCSHHLPEETLQDLDSLLGKLYTLAMQAGEVPLDELYNPDDRRTELETPRGWYLRAMKVGEWILVPAGRVLSARQAIYRLGLHAETAGMRFQCKKLPGGNSFALRRTA